MRSQTVIDPVHYYNVWSVKTEPEDGYITLGWNYFPFWNSENSFWQGTTINYTAILSGTLTHEAGHYFGLYHVFQGGCDGVNDEVSDTPAMAEDANTSCNSSQDSCPDDEGLDPVRNHMNYSNCRDEFTSGQADRGYSITNIYHPGLLENSFYYPNLYYSSLNFSNNQVISSILYILVLAIFSSAIAQTLFNVFVKIASPLFASSVTYTMPVVAILWAVLDGEELTLIQYFASVIILFGVYLVNQKEKIT